MKKRHVVDKRKFRRALIILNVVSASAVIFGCFLMIRAVHTYQSDRITYNAVASEVVAKSMTGSSDPITTEAPYYLSNNWKPPKETPPITVDFSAVASKNTNIVAWLYCMDTQINYPVVSCSDNNYFLTHDYLGQKNKSGAIFSDERNSDDLYGDNIILYGHHMKDRSMFGSLVLYQKQTYLDDHKTLYLYTPEKNYRITVFAAWFCDDELSNYPIQFTSEESKERFFKMATQESIANAYQEYHAGKRIISLVTCSYSEYIDNPHFQVNGWLTEIGDSSENN